MPNTIKYKDARDFYLYVLYYLRLADKQRDRQNYWECKKILVDLIDLMENAVKEVT